MRVLPRRGSVRAAIAVVALLGSSLLGTVPAAALPADPSRGLVYDCDDPDALHSLECSSRNRAEWGSISGTVTAEDSGGAGVADVSVGVYDDNWRSVGSAVTDADGSFAINQAPGKYYLRYGAVAAYQPEWSGNARTIATAEPVTVVAGQVTHGVDAVLDLPGAGHGGTAAVWGRVLDEATQAPIYVSVELWSEDRTVLIDQTWSGYGDRRSGEFVFPTLPAGSYQLRVGAVNPNGYSDYEPEWYTGATTVSSAPPVDGCGFPCSGGHVVHLTSPTQPLTSIPRPYVSGELTVGSTVKAAYLDSQTSSAGFWEPAPVTLAYRWQRDGVDIPDATDGTYTLVEADAGHSVRVVVTASKDGYRTVTRTSGSTTKVLGAVLSPAPTPTISGTTVVGETLTVDPMEWGPQPVELTYEWYREGGSQITSSDGPTLRLGPSTAEQGVYVKITARKPFYTTLVRRSALTAPVTGVVQPRVPVITGVPVNDYHAPVVGTTLTASTTGWSPTTTTFTYQWHRSGQPIPGAVDPSYQVVKADAGHRLTVSAMGSFPGYISSSETSASTNPVPGGIFATAPTPTISGTAAIGQTLTAKPGTWSPAAEVFHYQWLSDGQPLWQADGPTYTIPKGSGDSRISVRVTAYRQGFDPMSRTSAKTAKIFPASPNPTISGTRTVGSTLTAKPGTWMYVSAPSFSYQWYRDGAAISGATKSTYKLTVWDAGKRITVRVTGKKTGYETTARTSSATGMITGGKFSTPPTPKISGTTKVGSTLTASAGTWAPTAALTYNWKRNGTTISGATGRSYTLTRSDAGARITVSVTAKRTGFPTTTKTSAATVTITGGQFTGGTVVISGTKKVGATLTANRSGFSPTPSSYAYQWYRNGVAIAGATASTYKATGSDSGRTLSVKVAAKRSGFDTKKVTSAGYGPIVR